MICTVDEEGDMTGSDHIVEQEFVKKEDYVLVLEPTDGEIQMAHKGRLWFHVHVKGIEFEIEIRNKVKEKLWIILN